MQEANGVFGTILVADHCTMKLLPVFLSLVGCICCAQFATGQILNVEKERIVSADSAGWFGDFGINLSAARNTKNHLVFSANSHLQHKRPKSLFLLLMDFGLVKAEGEEFANSGFGHLRYNTKLGEVVRWEAFTQLQYNRLTKINQRFIAGTGPRFKLTPYESAKFYWGIAYMFEYEENVNPVVILRDHRISSYFSFTLTPVETVSFISTTYVQPLIKDFNDYRVLNESVLKLGISGSLSFNTTFQISYDANPPFEVPLLTYALMNGILFEF